MLNPRTRALHARSAEILKGVAHPLRIGVVDFLKDGERCVCDIAEHLSSERSNVSRHLAVMHKAGVLRSRKEGLMVYYSLRTPCILKFLTCAHRALKHNASEEAKVLSRV